MILKPMKGSDRAYMWQVHADFAGTIINHVLESLLFLVPWHDKYCTMLLREICILDEEATAEVLAIRFSNPENASKFKAAFDNAVINVTELEAKNIELSETDASEDATKKETNESPAQTKESEKEITEELKNLTVEEK